MPGRFSLWFALPPSSPPWAPGGAGTGRVADTGWPPPWSSQFGKYSRADSPGKKEKFRFLEMQAQSQCI